jgi:hypothetical protein
MTLLEMRPLQANFPSQEQAESAIRKLSALRGDRFRLERAADAPSGAFGSSDAGYLQTADDSGMTAALSSEGALYSGELSGAGDNWTGGTPSAEFSLSVHIPADAVEQARTVIVQAGGQLG